MHGNVATRPLLWDKLYPGLLPPSPVTAVTVPDNRFTLEGHDLVMVDVGHGDADDAKIERYPDHLGRLILWVTARALYGVREHPGENPAQITLIAAAQLPGRGDRLG